MLLFKQPGALLLLIFAAHIEVFMVATLAADDPC
jgi:hypothetical protein